MHSLFLLLLRFLSFSCLLLWLFILVDIKRFEVSQVDAYNNSFFPPSFSLNNPGNMLLIKRWQKFWE